MKITYNASAMLANNALTRADNKLSESLERLSSGLKIVNAKDNPSGLAMAKRMNAQMEGLDAATDNAGDGISVVEIADGTMGEIQDMLQRLNELAVKASNGTLSDDDRALVSEEVEQLMAEIDRIASESEFNGQNILDGSFDLKGYTDNVDVKVATYSDDVRAGSYTLENLSIVIDDEGIIDTTASSVTLKNAEGETVEGLSVKQVDGDVVTLANKDGFELKLQLKQGIAAPGTTAISNVSMDLEGFGAMDTQIGANEGQQLGIRIPEISTKLIGISSLDVTTQEGATKAIEQVSNAVKYVSSARSRLGAYENRLDHTVSSLELTTENMTSAYSRIMDTDMSEEMVEYSTLQIISQSSTSMLAQANERPSQILQLLQ